MVFVPIFYHVWFLKSQPERKNLPGIDPPTKNGSGLDLEKNSFLKTFTKRFLSGKETIQILVFQIICEFQTATNIAPFI